MSCGFPSFALALAPVALPKLELPAIPTLPSFPWAGALAIPAASLPGLPKLAIPGAPSLALPALPKPPSLSWLGALGLPIPKPSLALAGVSLPALSLPQLPALPKVPCPFD